MADRWIEIPNWRTFQHYRDRRAPWIKLYSSLLDDPDWLALTLAQRGLLCSIWILYAKSDGQIPASPAYLANRLGLMTEWEYRRHRSAESVVSERGERGESVVSFGRDTVEYVLRGRDLKALETNGFIHIVASRPLALRYQAASPEGERERETPKGSFQQPVDNSKRIPFNKPAKPDRVAVNAPLSSSIVVCPECDCAPPNHQADCTRLEPHTNGQVDVSPFGERDSWLDTLEQVDA